MIAIPNALDLGIVAALTLSCGGSLVSMLGIECKACSKIALLVGGLPLGAVGTAGYGLLIALFFWRPDSVWVRLGLAFAVGAHLALVHALYRGRARCLPCAITATGAFAAAALYAVAGHGAAWQLAAVPISAAAVSYGTAKWAARFRIHSMLRAKWVGRELAREHRDQLASQPLTLVLFARPHCEPCQVFKTRDLPILLEHYGRRLQVREQAVNEDQFLTPSVVALTPGAPMVFPTFFCSQKDVLDHTDRMIREGLEEYDEHASAPSMPVTSTPAAIGGAS